MTQPAALAIINTNIDEEACVLEIWAELRAACSHLDADGLKRELIQQLQDYAAAGSLGFYLDTFGEKDVQEIDIERGLGLLQTTGVWEVAHEPKLHVFRLNS